ncbi:hypothetical protein BGZ65_005996 [Modicella reniformis]|uniref:G-patch domain-containing protein n=1 Tax=Modicella reniformis TaxID=1440133 RepID=A0A9P6LS58_9FUNG|nr:hypothetical protein BGZ65_005996 [Modicella reniformis]
MSNIQDESEEEDYMSEAFLNKLVQESSSDNAKKNDMTYSERRRQKHLDHLANLPKPLHVREKEAREKGLETEIGEDNKGMAMLLKMGFKKGGTLGVSKSCNDTGSGSSSPSGLSQQGPKLVASHPDALRAPLAIQMKQGRGGLGMDTVRKRKAEEKLQRLEKETLRVFDEGYRGQKGDQFQLEKQKRQLGAARAICMCMDAKRAESDVNRSQGGATGNLGRSNIFWWIADSVPDEILGTPLMGPGAETVMEEEGQDRRLSSGTQAASQEESLEFDKEKRTKLDPLLVADEEAEPPKWGEHPAFAQLEVPEKLDKVVQYLRDEYNYCFWCASQYDGPEDLVENCPGETEDDH